VPQYFLDLPSGEGTHEWDPRCGGVRQRRDTTYWAGVFVAMEELLRDPAIDVYLTFDTRRLPRYGGDVVAVVLGDELGAIPRYLDRVRAVFKCYGTRPALGAGPLRDPGLTGMAELVQYGVRWLRWLPSGVARARLALRGAARTARPVAQPLAVPLGTFNQVPLPLVPLEQRGTDLFFAGSIEHRGTRAHRLLSAKVRSRREMLAAVRELNRARPELRIDLRLTDSFSDSEASPARDYSAAMMQARICLAPRGTSVETFRLLEGLRCGCVVVAPRLPKRWFYDGSPVLELDRWRELAAHVSPMLDDPAALQAAHEQSLSWWQERCSEAAVGRFLAERLNALAPGGPAPKAV
jgi:hypothetical protein